MAGRQPLPILPGFGVVRGDILFRGAASPASVVVEAFPSAVPAGGAGGDASARDLPIASTVTEVGGPDTLSTGRARLASQARRPRSMSLL